jgi:signal transduction histidine kinase
LRGFLVVGLIALGALAAVALRLRNALQRERKRSGALREALEARIWEDHVREVDQLEATVRELRRRGHEVNNALSTALLSTQLFFDASRAGELSPNALAELTAAADGMVDALQRMKLLIESGRRPETTAAPSALSIRTVDLLGAVHASAERVRAQRPSTELVVHEPGVDLRALRVAVCAGSLGLARALDALLENACAGDGVRMAARVEVRFGARREVDVVALEIADAGPGFTRTELGRPIAAFETTKPGALGLGLYTAERIARASGGSLRRDNAASGGAVVTLFLPVASEPAPPQ